jgi:hypothetical protein
MTVAQIDHTIQFDAALRSLAARAALRYPGEQARIDRGLVLALNHHVTLRPDGTATVQSGSDAEVAYHVRHGQCDCPDAVRATAPHCKHVWGVCLVKKAQRLLAPTHVRIAYHATYQDQHGQAIRDEHGRVWFQGDDDRMTRLYDVDRPALTLHGRVDLAADQRRRDREARTDLTQLDQRRQEAIILAA